jgi:hypothetical protein
MLEGPYIYLPIPPFSRGYKAFNPESLRARNPNSYVHQDQS